MCGIAGFIHLNAGLDAQELESRGLGLAGAIAHRGPDADGVWADPACGVSLAHRRLSIIDLSPAGAQPMASHSGRYVTVFNGEIYNYEALRAELPTITWRGHSDTEVLLEAIETWGLEATLRRAVGMYAWRCGTGTSARCTWCATGWAKSRSTTAWPAARCCSAPSSRR